MVDMTESEFVRHEPCVKCGSSDANSVYTDGHMFCFSCQTYTPAEGINLTYQMSQHVELKGHAQELRRRGLSHKTCEFFRIFREGDTLRFPYFTSDGVLKGIKIKNKQKEFYYEGVSTDTLFGQHLFPNTGKRIVVTEGELDAASCYEAMPGWPMVCLLYTSPSPRDVEESRMPSSA